MKSVLVVVEDDLDMQLLIRITLQSDGRLELSGHATRAEAAIELARQLQPDLVILDHFIDGEIMGLEAAPLIKQAAPNALVLLFTSHDLRVEARREPAVDEFLRKHDMALLLPTVQRLLDLESKPAHV
jgi:DNA-binding NarL/FixJ family response regulator